MRSRDRRTSVRSPTSRPMSTSGEVGKLDQGGQRLREGCLVNRFHRVDDEQPNQPAVKAHRRVCHQVIAEPRQDLVVGVPASRHPRLDPRSFGGTLAKMLAALVGKPLERWVGLAGDHEAKRDRTAADLEDEDLRGGDSGQSYDLATDGLRRDLRSVARAEAPERLGDEDTLSDVLRRTVLACSFTGDIPLHRHVARHRTRRVPNRRDDGLLGEPRTVLAAVDEVTHPWHATG